MQTNREVTIPARTEQIVDKTFCDICRQEIKEPGLYEVNEISIDHRYGSCYPDGGGETVTISFDACGDCFSKHIVTLFKNHGSAPRIKEYSY